MDTAVSIAVPQSLKWYEVWREVVLHPSVKTIDNILADPAASPRRAYIWMAVVGLITGMVAQLFTPSQNIVRGIFFVILQTVGGPVGLAIGALVLHWLAGRRGGTGSFSSMVYAIGAISAPFALISLIVSGVLSDSLIGSLISLGLSLYMITIQAKAIQSVETLDSKKAWSVLITLLLVAILLAVVFVVILALLGPALGAI